MTHSARTCTTASSAARRPVPSRSARGLPAAPDRLHDRADRLRPRQVLRGADRLGPVYLAPWINDIVPGTAHQAMLLVGVVEIAAGVLVALAPRLGGYVVALWLAGIIVNLLTLGDFFDVALRDFGLLVGALALARLATPDADGPNSRRRLRRV